LLKKGRGESATYRGVRGEPGSTERKDGRAIARDNRLDPREKSGTTFACDRRRELGEARELTGSVTRDITRGRDVKTTGGR